ncbi:MAG: putative metalloprotease CJM1_0395 family protein [Minwuia sp.]|uniref:putative metalloprotease CJM1_0395 family protein n=1 Tax=Minwuia sp. TaxID=2493630 RepID=UPI003A872725
MIAPLQPIAPPSPVKAPVRPASAEPAAFERTDRNGAAPVTVQGQRGASVSGNNLIAAQEEASKPRKPAEEAAAKPAASDLELSEEDKKQVRELRARDLEVRAHEQAHQRAGGRYASAPSYEFERGPDGNSYAVGGHVSISTSPIPGDPQATIDKMDQVKRAALAPSEPSSQDRSVAADAQAKRADAQAELNAQKREEQEARFGETGEDGRVDAPSESDRATAGPGETTSKSGADEFGNGQDESGNAFGAVEPGQPARFADMLDRAVSAVSTVVAGGIGRLEMQPGQAADAVLPTRRTGVDIRV